MVCGALFLRLSPRCPSPPGQSCEPAGGSLLCHLLPGVLSERFRGVCEFRTSQPTPKIAVWEATTLGSPQKPHQCHHWPHPEEQPALPGWELGSQGSDPSCYHGSRMQSPADRAGSDTRERREVHTWRKKGHDSRGQIAAFPALWRCHHRLGWKNCAWEWMDSLVQKSVPGWWEILGGERVGFKSLLCSPSPIPELCVVGKNEMGTIEDIFWGGGEETADGKRV